MVLCSPCHRDLCHLSSLAADLALTSADSRLDPLYLWEDLSLGALEEERRSLEWQLLKMALGCLAKDEVSPLDPSSWYLVLEVPRRSFSEMTRTFPCLVLYLDFGPPLWWTGGADSAL